MSFTLDDPWITDTAITTTRRERRFSPGTRALRSTIAPPDLIANILSDSYTHAPSPHPAFIFGREPIRFDPHRIARTSATLAPGQAFRPPYARNWAVFLLIVHSFATCVTSANTPHNSL